MAKTWLSGLGLALSCLTQPAASATISIVHRDPAGTLVGVEGDLNLADGEKFATLVRPLGNSIVLFNSRGGSLLAGLRIGQLIRSRGFGTLVPDDDVCASACALAWLGGNYRLLGPKAHLGFHAAYMNDGGAGRVSGSGNALVGAYLDRLGLSDDAIYELTDSAPADIHWLDVRGARRLGIAVEEFRMDDVLEPAEVATSAPVSPRQRAIAMVNAYFVAGSNDATSALAWLSTNYATTINFYGKATPLRTVLQQKRAFVARWPERLYVPVDRTTVVACSPEGTICRVSGTVQFECRSYTRGAYSAGLASYTIAVDMSGSRPRVTGEGGKVLARR